jgi:SNF2 family DNA or RNA helicase
MLKKVRKKVATSVSKIEYTDYYEFSKWLRIPVLTHIEFGILNSLNDTTDVPFGSFELPITYKSKFLFPPTKITPIREKLTLKRAKAVLVFFAIAKPQQISFRNKLLSYDEETLKKNFLIEIITQIFPIEFSLSPGFSNSYKFNFSVTRDITKVYTFSLSEPEINSVDLLVQPPEIHNKLSELIPEVYNIELLNENNLMNEKTFDLSQHIIDIDNLPLPEVKRFMIPGIDDLATHVINYKPERIHPSKVSELKFSKEFRVSVSKSPKIDFKKTTTKVLKFVKTDSTLPQILNPLEDTSSSAMERKLVKHILTGSVKATWEKTRKVIPEILPYQEEGAKFLVDNNFTVLAEEPGSDKQIQVIGAIKFLYSSAQIKSALIITKKTRLGNINTIKKIRTHEGLLGRLIEFAPEISFEIISASERTGSDKSSPLIRLIAYEDVTEINSLFDEISFVKNYDLVIVDEFTDCFNSGKEIENLFRRFYPDYFWFLTGDINSELYKNNFNDNYLPEGQSWKYFIRSTKELANNLPNVKYENIWFDPEQGQIDEYEELLDSNKDELKRVIESLNPFKFQATVFSLIHRIKQISNFSTSGFDSPKSRFLIDQLKITAANKRKTLLFTQYDNLGLKRIEKILEKENIRYLSVQSGSSPDDLKRALNLFYTRDDYPIFMTNLKSARIKANLNRVNYIVNFDQWWNPSTAWQTEEDLGLENYAGQQIVYYNYLMANSFDEKIYEVLESKAINNKEIFGELSGESLAELISEYDWQRIFDLQMNIFDKSEDHEFIRNTLNKYSVDDFSELVKRIFMRLGYRDIDIIELQDEPAFYVFGRSGKLRSSIEFRAKCILAKNVAVNDWDDILEQETNKAKFERLFVISPGIIKKADTPLKRKVNFIFGDKLINLINQLNLISKDTIKLRKIDDE